MPVDCAGEITYYFCAIFSLLLLQRKRRQEKRRPVKLRKLSGERQKLRKKQKEQLPVERSPLGSKWSREQTNVSEVNCMCMYIA